MTMSLKKQAAAGEDDPLFDVLGRVSAEIRDAAALIERLEPMLSTGRSTEFLQSPDHMRIMQGIDLAVQKTRGLAVFLDMLGAQLDADQLVDITNALNLVTLSDMKKRLRATVDVKASCEASDKASGDFDIF